MHPNPSFRNVADTASLRFAQMRSFGVISVNGSVGPVMAHLPFLLCDDSKIADMHLVRSNEIAGLLNQPLPATLVVSGPDGYVSPDWYGVEDQVPTWNYVAVHLRGHLEALPDEELRDILERQSDAYEARTQGKTPWTLGKLTDETYARMARMIRPARLHIERVESTWKLGQNKGVSARSAASEQLENGFGHELQSLAEMMRNPPE